MATRSIVPRANGEGGIGTSAKKWGNGHYNALNVGKLIFTDSLIEPSIDDAYNIGTANKRISTIHAVTFDGVATSARYADLAEKYTIEDNDEMPIEGTVISVNYDLPDDHDPECEICMEDCSPRVIGAISLYPAFKMNANGKGHFVALVGKVRIRIVGPVKKGDILVSAGNGCARVASTPEERIDKFAYALESNEDVNEKLIMCIIK